MLWGGVRAGTTSLAQVVNAVLGDAEHWEQDLTLVPGLAALVTEQLQAIVDRGMRDAVAGYC